VSLVLLDLGPPDHQGRGALTQWIAMVSDVPVVVLSADERSAIILAAVDAGAAGFIPKTVHARTMQEALQCVLGGGVYLPMWAQASTQAEPVQAVRLPAVWQRDR
jgi:DNA-binding NarL/FixJ family response regulator